MIRRALMLIAIAAAPAFAADKLPPELAVIPPDAGVFVSVRLDRLMASPLGKAPAVAELVKKPEIVGQIQKHLLGFPVTEIERLTALYPVLPGKLTPEDLPVFVVTRAKAIDRSAMVQNLSGVAVAGDEDEGVRKGRRPPRRGEVFEIDHEFLLSFVGDRSIVLWNGHKNPQGAALLGQLIDPSPDAPLAPALAAAAGKSTIVVGATGETIRTLLAAWGEPAFDFKSLGEARVVTAAVDLEPGFRLMVTVDFPDAVRAKGGKLAADALARWAGDALGKMAAGRGKEDAELAGLLRTVLRDAGEAKVNGTTVTFTASIPDDAYRKTVAAAVASAAVRIRDAAERMKSANNLKQFGLAIFNYHDTYGFYPFQNIPKEQMHPGLSWRVAILPFIEQDNLYRQFKLDEPWDSENNKKLIEKMPKIFVVPGGLETKAGQTYYRMFDGPGTLYRMKTIRDVTDGTSNTLMVVEAGEPVIWTKPDELPYDPDKPLPKVGGHFPGGFNALFGDASVRFIRKGIDEKVLRALITANGGEPVTLDKD
jgi:hypothetical protein